MFKFKRLVTGSKDRRIESQNVCINNATTLNDLPEEILAKILEKTPKNEIRNFRLISRNFNSSISDWFGTTLAINASRQDFPESLRSGHVTILKLKDCDSLNPQDLPPLSRLRKLEIEGAMRLQTLAHILGESPNLRKVSIKFPDILEVNFDGTMLPLDDPPARIEVLSIIFEKKNELAIADMTEWVLLQTFSELPLSSLKNFSCIYATNDAKQEEETPRMDAPPDLSSFIKTILTKSRETLKVLYLTRPYDWLELEEPESTPIESELQLKSLGLHWVGQSLSLWSLLDAQRTRSGLESLIISCYEDFWVEGIVQEVALASNATLKKLRVDLHLEENQIIEDELSLGFLDQLSKLELFEIKSKRGFERSQGRRTLEEPMVPLILPPTLKKVVLSAPITFQTLQSFCTLPALEEITLEGFKWVDWLTVRVIQIYMEVVKNGIEVNLRPSILLDWKWLMNLLKNSPNLKSINFSECVLDFNGIVCHLLHLAKNGVMVDFEAYKRSSYLSLDLDTPDEDKQTLFTYSFSLKIAPTKPATFIDVCKSILSQVGHVFHSCKE